MESNEELCLQKTPGHAQAGLKTRALPGIPRCLAHADHDERERFYIRARLDYEHDRGKSTTLAEGQLANLRLDEDLIDEVQILLHNVPDSAVNFRDSTFGGQVDFRGLHFGNAHFDGTKFQGEAGFEGAVFGGEVSFDRASFGGDQHQAASFNAVRFEGEAGFEGAVFLGDVSFDRASFGGDQHQAASFNAVRFEGEAGFEGAVFGGDVSYIDVRFGGDQRKYASFGDAQFQGEVGFQEAVFGGDVSFDGAKFGGNRHRPAGFYGAQFEGRVGFEQAVFGGDVSFSEAKLAGYGRQAWFVNAQFEGEAGFEHAVFGADASFTQAVFGGDHHRPASFNGAHFDGGAGFEDAVFRGDSSFDDAKFGGDHHQRSWFDKAQFDGEALFEDAVFGGDTSFDGAKFGGDRLRPASFYGAHFEGWARFAGAVFGGDVSFRETKFGGDQHKRSWFGDAQFEGEAGFEDAVFGGDASFDGAKFGGDRLRPASFYGAHFEGWARFEDAVFGGDASFSEAKFGGDQYRPANFYGAQFEGDAEFERTVFGGDASFTDTKFGGDQHRPAFFDGAQFEGDASFDCSENASDEIRQMRRVDLSHVVLRGITRFDRRLFGRSDGGGSDNAEIALIGARVGGDVAFVDVIYDGAILLDRLVLTAPITIGPPRSSSVSLRESTLTKPLTLTGPVADGLGPADTVQLTSLQNATLEAPLVVGEGMALTACTMLGATGLENLRITVADPKWKVYRRRRVIAEELACREATSAVSSPIGPDPRHVGRILRRRLGDLGITVADPQWPTYHRQLIVELASREASPAIGPAAPDSRQVEAIYRQLRAALEASKAAPAAADFYYGEMEMRRLSSRGLSDRVLLTVYKLTSGYGLRAYRALWSYFILLLATTFLLRFQTGWFVADQNAAAGSTGLSFNNFWDVLAIAARSSVSFLSAVTTGLTAAGTLLFIVLRLAGPATVALTILALRAKVQR